MATVATAATAIQNFLLCKMWKGLASAGVAASSRARIIAAFFNAALPFPRSRQASFRMGCELEIYLLLDSADIAADERAAVDEKRRSAINLQGDAEVAALLDGLRRLG